jgi:hypothetical protein
MGSREGGGGLKPPPRKVRFSGQSRLPRGPPELLALIRFGHQIRWAMHLVAAATVHPVNVRKCAAQATCFARDFPNARAIAMNSSANGPKVRFLTVNIPVGRET